MNNLIRSLRFFSPDYFRIILVQALMFTGIAFNILNVGRFKLGAMCVGGARSSLNNAVAYAKQRKAFGKVIADFGLVREKLANMAMLTYVGESMVYRTIGMMDEALSGLDMPLQAQMLRLLMELQARHGLTYLYISHDLNFVSLFAQEVVVMDSGRIVERTTPAQLAQSTHPATRELLEASERLHAPGVEAAV